MNKFSVSNFIVVMAAAIFLSLLMLLTFEIKGIQEQYAKVALYTSQSYFDTILELRKWNSLHGGVYVPITEEIQPNPYLEDPLRDVETREGLKLTKVNPAYMTRLYSEIANQDLEVQLRMASLQPLNPQNEPDPWEREALQAFEEGAASSYVQATLGDTEYFRYMEPLKIEELCLECHAKQGYKVGDIKGGISVSMPYKPFENAQRSAVFGTTVRYLAFLLVIAAITAVFGRKLISAEKKLQHLATGDELTGLKNHRYLVQRLEEEVERSRRYSSPLSLIVMDLDKFKAINDTCGHLVGDRVLQVVGQVIQSVVRNVDITGRYGGDEFVVILPETAPEDARIIAERIRQEIETAIQDLKLGVPFQVTASLGVAHIQSSNVDSKAANWLFNKSDEALYEAKRRGGNRVVIASA